MLDRGRGAIDILPGPTDGGTAQAPEGAEVAAAPATDPGTRQRRGHLARFNLVRAQVSGAQAVDELLRREVAHDPAVEDGQRLSGPGQAHGDAGGEAGGHLVALHQIDEQGQVRSRGRVGDFHGVEG